MQRACTHERLLTLCILQVVNFYDITKLSELALFPDIVNHHGSDGLQNIYESLRATLDGVDDDELLINSYSSILTGADEMSTTGVVTDTPRVICNLCGKYFHARGMPMHKMACVKKYRPTRPLQHGNFSQTSCLN